MKSIDQRSLIQSKRRWQLVEVSQEETARLAVELGISQAFARVLAGRAQGAEPKHLLKNDLSALSPPSQLLGIERALERIEQALQKSEKIFIHGDFDVDGLTSTALLYKALQRLGAQGTRVEIEDRARGHGLNPQIVQEVLAGRFQLLITTDCGISDVDCVRALKEHGVDVIITDHHEPPKELPPAVAIINPRQAGCTYPNADLAAVGVVYQTVAALFEHRGLGPEACQEYLDLVMLGTVGDLVPLVRGHSVENRALVKAGLDLLAQGGGSLGLRVLLEKMSLDPRRLSAGEISYIVVPKLNAANRVGDPRVAFLLLITSDRRRADHLADTLLQYNYDRQVVQDDLRFQAEQLLHQEIDFERDKIFILAGQYWNPGVIGLVAADLAEKYYRPTILLAKGDEYARASGRSIPEFNLIRSLTHHSHLLERYGGHPMAAGFLIKNDWIPRLKEELGEYARRELADLGGPVQIIDTELGPEEIDLRLYEELQRLGPFGVGNREPRFLLRNAWVSEARALGNGSKHLKLKLKAGEQEFDTIGFELGDYLAEICQEGQVDLVFKLGRDDWGGRSKVQLELLDVLSCSNL